MNDVIFLILANVCIIFAVVLALWKSWLDNLRPDWFYIFRIYENNMLNYKDHKIFLPFAGYKEIYKIKAFEYDKSAVKPYINEKGVYTWHFELGKNKPIVANPDQPNISSQSLKDAKDQSIDKILRGEKGLAEYLPYIVIGLVIVVIFIMFYMMSQNQKSAQLTQQILINMTQRL